MFFIAAYTILYCHQKYKGSNLFTSLLLNIYISKRTEVESQRAIPIPILLQRFAIVQVWKHPEFSSTDEWIKCDIHNTYIAIYILGYHSALKIKGNFAICVKMDETWGHYAKWNKPVKEGQILYDSTYMRYLK